MKINYKQILINVIEHFADSKILYLLMTIILSLMWFFFAAVSINKELIAKGSIDISEITNAMTTITQLVWLFMTLVVFGCLCSFWIIFQDVQIKQSIKKYNLDIIK